MQRVFPDLFLLLGNRQKQAVQGPVGHVAIQVGIDFFSHGELVVPGKYLIPERGRVYLLEPFADNGTECAGELGRGSAFQVARGGIVGSKQNIHGIANGHLPDGLHKNGLCCCRGALSRPVKPEDQVVAELVKAKGPERLFGLPGFFRKEDLYSRIAKKSVFFGEGFGALSRSGFQCLFEGPRHVLFTGIPLAVYRSADIAENCLAGGSASGQNTQKEKKQFFHARPLISFRSTDHRPAPELTSARDMASTSRWYSYPSPGFSPFQFIKKP